MIGKTISHYKILEHLGGGGMGVVYKAEDTKLKRMVALKFLPPAFSTDPSVKERFIHEAQAASALQHSNICTIHEVNETDDGQMYIVMDYYEGQTLRFKIDEGRLTTDECLDITLQISQGLKKAHEQGIIHRDIKPANIMITKDDEVKILDFGLARTVGGKQLTQDKSTAGTIQFMSPEQIEGKIVDHRTDIWSLGVILYEMLTGELPFKGEYESAIIYSVLNETPKPITGLDAKVPAELEGIVNKCLEKYSSDRYQHIDDLMVDIRKVKRDSDSRIDYTRKDVKIEPPKKRFKSMMIPIIILIILIMIVGGYFFINRFVTTEVPDSKAIADTQWENSIAVLPFKNISADPEQEPFVDGITDQIITNLSRLEFLKVIGRTSVMQYKNTIKTIPEIGKELNVATILEGSASRFGNRIRVIVQLVETKEGTHLWADNYDYSYELDSILTIFDDTSEKIANALVENLSSEDVADLKSEKPSNVEAYEYYLKGKYFHLNRFWMNTWSMEDFNKSESMLKKAIELDPNYAPSYAALADLYNSYFNNLAESEEELEKYLVLQEQYINEGYKIDPNSVEVNSIMGFVQEAKGEIEKAYESFKKAILIQPNSWEAIYGMAGFYRERNLYNLALTFYNKTIVLNPLYPMSYIRRSVCFSALGEFEKAEIDLREALEIKPDHRSALSQYGLLLIILKKYEKAEKIISKREKLYPESNFNQTLRALLLAANGEKAKALEIELNPINKFRLYLILKMKEEIIQYLIEDFERKKNEQGSWYVWFINHPSYEFLHSDPRFQEILAKHKELYQEILRKYGDLEL